MAQQTIGIGTVANDGTGDPIRAAFDKCNDNFTELYAGLVGLLDFKGSTDCSANPNYPAASKGDAYVVSVAGKIGGASGEVVEAGDVYFATADNAGGTEAGVGASWTVIQGNVVAGAAGVAVEDEGTPEAAATTLNFIGAGVSASDQGAGVVDISIPGGSSGTAGLIGVQIITATGAGTYTPTTGTASVVVEGVGGGGSGGGADAVAGQTAIAQSASGAGYFRKRLTSDFSGAAYVVGAGASAPAAGNNAGSNGAATTFTDTAGSPTVYTAPAGLAGALGVSANAASFYGSRAGPAAGSNGDVKIGGGPSGPGHRLSASQGYTGNGGDSMLGRGGVGVGTFGGNTSTAGAAGTGYGSGGSGGVCEGTGAAVAGGAGANGILIIWEYS